MDETQPENVPPPLPPEPVEHVESVEVAADLAPPPLPQITTRSLVRDALVDLLGALGTGGALIFGASIIASVALGFSSEGTGALLEFLQSIWGIALLFLATQLPLVLFALRRRRRNRDRHRTVLPLFGGGGGAVRQGVLAGLGLTVVSIAYTATLEAVFGKGTVNQQLDFLERALENKPAVALLVFIIAVMAPICEELFFRGVVFGSGLAAGKGRQGAAISAVLFAFVHLIPSLAPFYAVFAVVMCWLYARTGTLAAPIAAHATMNGLACLALLVAGSSNRV